MVAGLIAGGIGKLCGLKRRGQFLAAMFPTAFFVFLWASTGDFLAGGLAAAGALAFIPIWLVAALVNLWVGVATAGYSVREELPMFLLVFAVPSAAALLVWWKLS